MENRSRGQILQGRIQELRALKMNLNCRLSLCERELNENLAQLKRVYEEERRSKHDNKRED